MSTQLNKERLMTVLVGPHVSEKTATLGEKNNQICFRVRRDSTKKEIAQAVEMMFEVKVDAVTTANVRGKAKRFGQTMGRRANWKKAYVTLAEGHDIDFLGAE
ncbi:MAG: 50S ribosomal protein L23 [Chromatiales bacterium]|jgi:large subunit ribosomal protein L23|nr:50S ribosomal protein L23 [Chromatiales bacterium]MDP6151553.1 50S ribosomal protein L23 [Gammaproteobacteria bacterium]MDP7271429.1 50S ribosomal protein L23 [Gammaproteobacteria bacterium]HJP05723.1 50S ribosomal protein L23 [Gammaproteobacteria bacterium]